ncbi:hypothetical protein C8R44DRAFT_765865 [Mycena epipterygia]|nr:hypothetical protein C8R44DRAFT_765865 [Mycena epipterygia]
MALKRIHSSQTLVVPELPKLGGDTLLQVFTHKSLRRAGQPTFDNERLSVLGEKFLELLLTDALLGQRPMLTTSEITTRKTQFFDNVVLLVGRYDLLSHLRCHPAQFSALNTPEEAFSILYAYVGGIFVDYGDDGVLRELVQTWSHLLFPGSSQISPPLKKVKFTDGIKTEPDVLLS